MTSLLPGYKAQLGVRATQLAVDHQRRERWRVPFAPRLRRPHGHATLGVMLAVIATGGAAYASQGLWSPLMGDDQRGRPTVSGSPLSAELLDRFAVLRREQTDDDRGLGSRDALRWQSGGRVIQTAGVRRVGTGERGEAIVVIPFAHPETNERGETATPSTEDETRQICLWMQDLEEAGGMGCSDAERVARYGVELMTIRDEEVPKNAAARQNRDSHGTYLRQPQDAEAARRLRKWMRAHPHGGQLPPALTVVRPGGLAHWVALLPDGVAAVRLGPPEHQVTVAVDNNIAQLTIPERYAAPVVWLDSDGRDITPSSSERSGSAAR